MEAERDHLTGLRALDVEELTTLRDLRDASSTLADDLQAARAEVRRLNVELADDKRARPAVEARIPNVPTPSTRSGEAFDRLKTELLDSQGRVRRLTFELANEKKKRPDPRPRTPGARPTRAATTALQTERDSLIAERDQLRALVETHGPQVEQLSETLGAVNEELFQTRRRAALREDQLTHQRQLTHWQRTQFSVFQDEDPATHAHHAQLMALEEWQRY